MRKILGIAICLLAITSCSPKVEPVAHGGSVNLIQEMQDKSTIVVRSLGYGKNIAIAQEDAELRAIKAVLFSGFSTDHPAMLVESRVMKNNAAAMNDFFVSKAYKDCILHIEKVGSLRKEKGHKVKKMPCDITINTNSLRQKLRQKRLFKMGF
ncbi:MAG: hypothetical protein WCQ82_04275 [Bacteroidaceae bacterium]|nr:hypothetical protein [Bacteroidaceae bacterium]